MASHNNSADEKAASSYLRQDSSRSLKDHILSIKPFGRSQKQYHSCREYAMLEAGFPRRISGKRRCAGPRIRSRTHRTLLAVPVVAVLILVILYLTNIILGSTSAFPGLLHTYNNIDPGWQGRIIAAGRATSPQEITANVVPLQCHSHNDYWRRIPLYEALHYGCASVEADVWLTDERSDSELYVGHSFASLEVNHTLRNLYIDPLIEILDAMNLNETSTQLKGVFSTAPSQELVLLIDIKNKPSLTFEALSIHLEPLREKDYLTYHNGSALVSRPLTIVTTGSTPYDSILAQNTTRRDMFFDAPLQDLTLTSSESSADRTAITAGYGDYNTSTSLYASTSLRKILGPLPFLFPWSPTSSQLERIRSVTSGAHARGLKVRWWDTPAWPIWRKERTWRVLMSEGADVLNADDLKEARDWDGW